MNLSEINPHIRYAAVLYHYLEKHSDSICYDCRLFYAKNVNGICRINQLQYEISNNTVIFLPPGTRYHLHLDMGLEKPEFVVINFDLIYDYSHKDKSLGTASPDTFVSEQVISYPMPQEFSAPFSKKATDSMGLLSKCCDEHLTQNPYYRETASSLLKLFLMELIRTNQSDTFSAKIEPILDYIHHNYQTSDLSNSQIASLFNYHPYYLSQLFSQYTGKSLHQYLIQYRIKIAQKNLISTNDPVHVIAWKSGFQSTAYFIKLFKEQVGVTPKAYRDNHMALLF